MSLSHFLSMGGYAAFVWPAYAVTLVVLMSPMCSRRGRVIGARWQEARRRLQMSELAG